VNCGQKKSPKRERFPTQMWEKGDIHMQKKKDKLTISHGATVKKEDLSFLALGGEKTLRKRKNEKV